MLDLSIKLNSSAIDYLPAALNMAALLTLSQMAEARKLSAKTFRKYVIDHGIPHELYGRSMRFNPDVVAAYMTTTATPANVIQLKPTVRKSRTVKKSKFAEMVGV